MYREWKKYCIMNLESTKPIWRPRNRWLDEMREDGRIVGGEGWQEEVITGRNGQSS
jgi:hypothetical protein